MGQYPFVFILKNRNQYLVSYLPLFIILIVSLINDCRAASERLNVCVTKECYKAAEDIKSNINLNVDPCNDFYEFACGGWLKNNPLPPSEESFSPFHIANNKVISIIKDILESDNGININDPQPVQKAKTFYKSCINEGHIESRGLKPIIDLSNSLGGWPLLDRYWRSNEFNWLNVVVELSKLTMYPIFGIRADTDFKNSSQYIITVDQAVLTLLRPMLVSPELHKPLIDGYKLFIKQIAELGIKYQNNNTENNNIDFETMSRITEEVDDIFKFEVALAKISAEPEMRRDVKRMYNKMTIRDLQTWTDSASIDSSSSQPVAQINWLNVINKLFENTNLTFDHSEKIVVREVDFVFNLIKLLKKTSLKTIANYLHLRLFRHYIIALPKNVRDFEFQLNKLYTGAVEDKPRWNKCVRNTIAHFGFAVGYKYTQLYFDEKSKNLALEVVDNIISTFLTEMNKVSWMDEQTKLAAKDKVSNMIKFIGYPDWYTNNITYLDELYNGLNIGEDLFNNLVNIHSFNHLSQIKKLRKPIDRAEWPIILGLNILSPITINAYYMRHLNAIMFPAAILQPPFFTKGRPDSLNYGGIGMVIGHEITHGFDDVGRQYDKYGNLVPWWTDYTVEGHHNKTKCFIEQYNNFEVPELNDILFKTVKLNGLLTVGENMADNGGIHQAYLAYKRKSIITSMRINNNFGDNDSNGDIHDIFGLYNNDNKESFRNYKVIDVRLPGIEMFNNDQLFFLSFAAKWCNAYSKQHLMLRVLTDPHSPGKFRVLGSFANNPEFSAAFNCTAGSTRNPVKKCSLWS